MSSSTSFQPIDVYCQKQASPVVFQPDRFCAAFIQPASNRRYTLCATNATSTNRKVFFFTMYPENCHLRHAVSQLQARVSIRSQQNRFNQRPSLFVYRPRAHPCNLHHRATPRSPYTALYSHCSFQCTICAINYRFLMHLFAVPGSMYGCTSSNIHLYGTIFLRRKLESNHPKLLEFIPHAYLLF